MMNQDAAETYAITVLTWLLGQEDLVGVFMGSSGASIDDIKENAASPDFLAAVLDFVLLDDAWVIRFAEECGEKPELMQQARSCLPGGEAVHWT